MADVWITGASGGIGSEVKDILRHHRIFSRFIDVEQPPKIIAYELGNYRPEILVYVAGVNHLDWAHSISPVQMLHVLNVNVVGLVRCYQACHASLRRIVVVGSDAAHRPMRTSVAYNASKAALEETVKVIAREDPNVTINIVAPGLIEGTAMTEYVYERTRELRPDLDLEQYMLGAIPAGRAGKAREVARVVKWLVDDAPNYMNGSVVTINGAR